MDDNFVVIANLNLSACWPGVSPMRSNDYGVVFSGTAVRSSLIDPSHQGNEDFLFIGSGDGHLYAFDTALCTTFSMQECNAHFNGPQPPSARNWAQFEPPLRSGDEALRTQPLRWRGEAGSCLMWVQNSTKPWLGPTRVLQVCGRMLWSGGVACPLTRLSPTLSPSGRRSR